MRECSHESSNTPWDTHPSHNRRYRYCWISFGGTRVFDYILIAAILSIGITLNFGWVTFTRRLRNEKLSISINPTKIGITTDRGFIQFDVDRAMVVYSLEGARGNIPFNDITGLKLATSEESALGMEFLGGFDITDLLSKYRDKIVWNNIYLRIASENDLLIYSVGQYLPKEFLLTWWIDLQASILKRFGLFHTLNAVTASALAEIQSALQSTGVNFRQ